MEDLTIYIMEEALIIIPVLLIFGKLLKEINKFPDWVIPWVLLVISVVVTLGFFGISWANFIQAILLTGAAVYTNQLYKQTVVKRVEKSYDPKIV